MSDESEYSKVAHREAALGISLPDKVCANTAEASLDTLLTAIVDAVILMDEKGVIHRFNKAAERIFGYTEQEALGQNVTMLMLPDDASKHDGYLENYLKTGIAKIIGVGRQLEAKHKDGRRFPCELSVGEVVHQDGHFFVGILRDISTKLAMERESQHQREALAHVSRVSVMGEMAAGIAHELNQPLTAIANYATAGRNVLGRIKEEGDLTQLDQVEKALSKVAAQAIRAGDIISKLRTFSAKHSSECVTLPISKLIGDVIEILETDERKRAINLTVEIEANLPEVEVDEVQIQQVLINLIRNAFDAIGEQQAGRVAIEVSRLGPNLVEVAVSDNGSGLPESVLNEIFTPFVTTKAEGLGLGLAICHSIIDSHGGKLSYCNRAEGGVRFSFTLPVNI